MNVKGIKIKKVSIALFVLALACLVGLLPPVRSAAITLAEGKLGRALNNLPHWHRFMILGSLCAFVFFVVLFLLIQLEKEALPEAFFEQHAKTIGITLTAVFSACAAGFCFISADIWVDEAYSYSLLTPSLLQVATTLARVDLHPPLYHIIVKALSLIFGSNVHVMKLYSALPAVLFSIIAFRFLSKEFSYKAAAVFELFLLSLGGFFPYCYEIRMYSWAAFFCGLCAIFSFYIIKRGRLSDWVFYVLAAVCSAYTHHFAAVVIMCNFVALCAYKFVKSPAARKYIFIAAALGVVLYAPWVPVLLSKLGQVSEDF